MESLTEIIIALLKNSLDANCTSIAIRICLELFWIQVLDNGNGISQEDLQSIGRCCLLNIDHDRKKPSKQFARLTGESLLNIIAQCEEVLIESIDSGTNENKPHSRLFKQKKSISATNNGSQRNFDSVSQYHYVRRSRGTTVTLKNVFYGDAERHRNHSIREDYEKLLTELRKLALIHFDHSFTVQDLAHSEVIFKSKRLTAFLPKFCELYHLSETEIDVTTCTKDNVLIECYFSKRRIKHPFSPIELIFINGLPSNELTLTVDALLTQEKHDLDFAIVVKFPKNDVLTQQNEPIVRNCLFRCLNQYKECLRQRGKQQQSISQPPDAENIVYTPNSNRTMIKNEIDDFKFQHHYDEEDVLYGLSQTEDDRQTTFDKCTKWLKTNDFDVEEDAGPSANKRKFSIKQPHVESGDRQKINFFDDAPVAASDGKGINSRRQNNTRTKLPVPKFYPTSTKQDRKLVHVLKTNKQSDFKKEFHIPERPLEKLSFINMGSDLNESTITIPEKQTPVMAAKLKQFAKKQKKKLVHSSPTPISSQLLHPPASVKHELTFLTEFEKSNNSYKWTSFPNYSPCSTRRDDFFPTTPPVKRMLKIENQPSGSRSFEKFSTSRNETVYSEIPNAFEEPLFLEPVHQPHSDKYSFGSPKARFTNFDLVQSYARFHNACRRTIQHFKVAIESIRPSNCSSDDDDEDECACCSTHQMKHNIEILRQPFNKPRKIFTKVGNRNQAAYRRCW